VSRIRELSSDSGDMKTWLWRARVRIGEGEDATLRRAHGERARLEMHSRAHQAAPGSRVIGLVQGADAGEL